MRPTIGNDAEIRFLAQIGSLLNMGAVTPQLSVLDNEMAPHQVIIDALHAQAPWFSRAEIGWRVHAILGIRSHVQRRAARSRVMCAGQLDLDDPETVIGTIIDMGVAMFAPPPAQGAPLFRF